nr:bactericidal permeability-increasing protein-like [Anolis sagrei ordinatus]
MVFFGYYRHTFLSHTIARYPGKMFWLFSLVVLASCTPQSRALDGGIKIQLTQKGLEYGKEFGLQMLMSKLKNEKIQDIDGSYRVPLVGNVHYSVSEIQIKELQVNHCTAGFVEGTGLKLTIQNADFVLSGTWKYSASFGSETGIIDISIKQLSLSALLGLDKDDQGRPVVRQEGCQSSIGGLDLKLSGKSSWLYNMLASVLKGVLRSEVNKQVRFGAFQADSSSLNILRKRRKSRSHC